MYNRIAVPATLDKVHVLEKVGASLWLTLQRVFMHVETVSVTVSCATACIVFHVFFLKPQ